MDGAEEAGAGVRIDVGWSNVRQVGLALQSNGGGTAVPGEWYRVVVLDKCAGRGRCCSTAGVPQSEQSFWHLVQLHSKGSP